MGNFIKKKKKKKKKKHMGTDFSNPENQTHKHMIPIIHTVFSRSPPGFFFSIWVVLEPSDFFNWVF